MKAPLQIAVIGAGIAGKSHLLDAVTTPDVAVRAVCAEHMPSAESAAHDFGIARAYADFEVLLRRETLQGIIVATPPNVLQFQTLMALKRGLTVLAEKPLATQMRCLEKMAFAGRDRPFPVCVAYPRRYRKVWRQARAWLAAGKIGRIESIHAHWQSPYREWYGPATATFRKSPRRSVGGAFLDTGCHILDAVLFLTGTLGEPHAVSMEPNDNGLDIGIEVSGKQPCGADLCIEMVDSVQEEKTMQVTGAKGMIAIKDERATLVTGHESIAIQDEYVARPIDDMTRLYQGVAPLGALIPDAAAVTRFLLRAYAIAGAPLRHNWTEPRGKALSRLNGGC